MSILNRVPRHELGTKYTHFGWLYGIVPVYVGALTSDAPLVAERNWVPQLWMDLGESLFAIFCIACSAVSNDFEPAFPLLLTGRIE